MNESQLHDLLERATEDLPTRDRTSEALERTVVVRRRRAAAGLAGVMGAVVLAAVGISSLTGTERPAPSPPPATTSPDATASSEPVENDTLTSPPVDPRVVQDEWDPAAPLSAQDLRTLPASLAPPVDMPELTGMPRAAAVILTDVGLAAVDSDGQWQQLGLPEPQVANSVDTLALSVDGTTVSWAGRTSVWSRDVRGGPWREAAYPDGMSPNGRWGITLVPQAAEMTYIGQHSRWWELDLHTGDADELTDLPALRTFTWAGPGIVGLSDGGPPRLIRSAGPPVDTSALGALSTLAASADRIATLRYDEATESAALLALDPATGEAIAMLPIGGLGADYIAGGWLNPVAWLDSEQLLLSVVSPPDQQHRLVTWDTRTGDITQSSVLAASTEYWAVAP
jgi:hypothetical protein